LFLFLLPGPVAKLNEGDGAMAYTYDITTLVGKVRLTTGDKDITDAAFTDEEITYFLTEAGDDVALASAMLLESWAATYATSPSAEKIGDYSYSKKVVANMLALATKLRAGVAEAPYVTWGEMDLVTRPTGEV